MKKTTLARTAAWMAATAAIGAAQAEGVDVKVSGFGTVAATVTNDHDAAFRSSISRSKGVDNSIDIGNDSRFGLQGVVQFNDKISFTGQVVAQRRMTGSETSDFGKDKELDPAVEWLYLQYNAIPSLNLRLGRTAVNAFLLSDSLNVGYAAPWLRAPLHLYSSVALTHLDGVQANWHDSLGGFNLSAQAAYGKSEQPLYLANSGGMLDIKSDDVLCLNLTVEHGSWLGRLGLLKAPNPSDLGTIQDKYLGAGLQYDDGNWLVMAEYAKRSQNKLPVIGNVALVEGNYGYAAAGYRFGSVMPMLIWSRTKGKFADFLGGTVSKTSTAPGVSLRYDAAANVALKAQVDRYDNQDVQAFVTPGTDGRKVTVFTLGADFVF